MWMPFKRFTKWTSTFTLCTFLSQGRNSYAIKLVSQDLKYLTWQDAFKCLSDDSLPDSLRAHYAHLIISMLLSLSFKSSPSLKERGSERISSFIYQNWTLIIINKSTRQKWVIIGRLTLVQSLWLIMLRNAGLFVDVGENQSFLDQLSISYIYEDLPCEQGSEVGHVRPCLNSLHQIESEEYWWFRKREFNLKQLLCNNQYRVPMEEMEMNQIRRLNPWKFLKNLNLGSRDFWIRTPTWQLHKSVTINLWNRYKGGTQIWPI